MTVAIVGGGPTGVELAGAFADLVRRALKVDYRGIEAKTIIWAAGVAASPLTEAPDYPRDRGGRIEVEPSSSVSGTSSQSSSRGPSPTSSTSPLPGSIRSRRTGDLLFPGSLDLLNVSVPVGIFHHAVLEAIFVNFLGHFDVVATILGDIHHVLRLPRLLVKLPPLQGIQSVGRLANFQGGLGD